MPSPTMPQDLAQAMRALRAWVVGQIGTGGALVAYAAAPYNVVWGYQAGPKIAHPLASMSIIQPLTTIGGKPARELVDGATPGTFDERSEYDGEMMLRIEMLSHAALDPASGLDEVVPLLSGLEASLVTGRQTEAFAAAGLAFVRSRGPLSIPTISGFGYERRAWLDVVFRARVRVDAADVYVLDSSSFESPLGGIQGTVDENGATIGTVGDA